MQDLVISDTSCLILLSKLGQLDLLRTTYGTVLIPPEVRSEYERQADDSPSDDRLSIVLLPKWIRVVPPAPEALIRFQLSPLDRGEQAAFALASEHPGSLVIVDDRRARAIATRYGLRTTGTIGVLLAAKEAGNISAIKPMLDRIMETNFRISPAIIRQALIDAGEDSNAL